jgi:chorismate mutase / prephenate dehydratase
MSDPGEDNQRMLSQLRTRIDAIDSEMHRLLITRGTVIDALIKTKGAGRPGAAFRPAREAAMMRSLVERHEGALPLATVEHIWREIITTFTRMQAPFDVAMDAAVEPERMRDLARFVFGFSVSLVPVGNADAVVAAVAGTNSLGLIARAAKGAWWLGLVEKGAPKIMALLPFIDVPDRPVDLPAFVISPPLADPTPMDLAAFAVTVAGPMKDVEGTKILAGAGNEFLLAAPMSKPAGGLSRELTKAGVDVQSLSLVGAFARGITLAGRATLLYEARA